MSQVRGPQCVCGNRIVHKPLFFFLRSVARCRCKSVATRLRQLLLVSFAWRDVFCCLVLLGLCSKTTRRLFGWTQNRKKKIRKHCISGEPAHTNVCFICIHTHDRDETSAHEACARSRPPHHAEIGKFARKPPLLMSAHNFFSDMNDRDPTLTSPLASASCMHPFFLFQRGSSPRIVYTHPWMNHKRSCCTLYTHAHDVHVNARTRTSKHTLTHIDRSSSRLSSESYTDEPRNSMGLGWRTLPRFFPFFVRVD